jgi:hypothetical protein
MATLTSSTISSEFSNSKIVCNKEGVILLRDERRENGDNNNNNNNISSYRIIFNAHNPNFPIHSIVGLKLYTLLYELNRDIIHTFKVVNETETTIETVTLFKPFGKDFGIAPKAMHTVSTMYLEPGAGACIFNGVDVVQLGNSTGVNHIPKKYERIQSTHSKLIVYFLSANDLQFDFTFELSDDSNDQEVSSCPIYMENSVALMIKKMFCRFKGFTEGMA